MKRLSIICALTLCLGLMAPSVFAAVEYGTDFEAAPASAPNSPKSFDENVPKNTTVGLTVPAYTMSPGETAKIDVYCRNVPTALVGAGFWLDYDNVAVTINSIEIYDNGTGGDGYSSLPRPYSPFWDPAMSGVVIDPFDVGSPQFFVQVGTTTQVAPDAAKDVVMARLSFTCNQAGDTTMRFHVIGFGINTVVAVDPPGTIYDDEIVTNVVTIHGQGPSEAICNDGIDNDGDQLIDCADPDCNTLACDDGNACTEDDTCAGGQCQGSPVGCDDGDACTEDSCNPASGCVHTPITCGDGNACTEDSCNPASGCVHTPIADCCTEDSDCIDEDACTVNERCVDGQCLSDPLTCDDGNACTEDSCNPASGCVHTPIADCCTEDSDCIDEDACTVNERCVDSHCLSDPLNCDDGNACTGDSCNPASGCVHTPIADCCTEDSDCIDENACTVNERCVDSHCLSDPRNCDDGNACTEDSCDTTAGCQNLPVVNGTACEDGLYCTAGDTCADGSCQSGTGNPCEPPLECNEETDRCTCDADEDCLDDEFCNGAETCVEGECQPGTNPCEPPLECNEETNSCQEPPTPIPTIPECVTNKDCKSDGLFCTGIEACFNGKCRSAGNPCPDDGFFCNGTEGCDEDTNQCIQSGDPCAPDLICDEDNNVCVGCLDSADCADGLFCNGEERCDEDGVCQAGSISCPDDGLFCNGTEGCNENTDQCTQSGDPCEGGATCDEVNDRCIPATPPLNFDIIPTVAFGSHFIPLPLFMFLVSADEETQFDFGATNVTFTGDALTPPLTVVLSEDLIFAFSLINPAGMDAPDEIQVPVTVTVGENEGIGNLTLRMLEIFNIPLDVE